METYSTGMPMESLSTESHSMVSTTGNAVVPTETTPMPPAGTATDLVPVVTTVVIIDVFPAISTSTVYSTREVTVTSCAESVTNCPARSASVVVITEVTAVSTTLCPLTLTSSYTSEVVTSMTPTPMPSSSAPGTPEVPSVCASHMIPILTRMARPS